MFFGVTSMQLLTFERNSNHITWQDEELLVNRIRYLGT
jgi:hypothetical protein